MKTLRPRSKNAREWSSNLALLTCTYLVRLGLHDVCLFGDRKQMVCEGRSAQPMPEAHGSTRGI